MEEKDMKDNRTPIAVEEKLITKYKEDALTVKEPSDSSLNMNAVDAKICRDVINNIRAKKYADCNYLFLDSVDTTFFPTYTKVVKKPMDLGTAARNLDTGIYNNRKEFFADLELCYKNVETFHKYFYYPENQWIIQKGKEFQKYLDKERKRVEEYYLTTTGKASGKKQNLEETEVLTSFAAVENRKVSKEDAQMYADEVRITFLSYPHIYENFLEAMKLCQSQKDVTRVILRIVELFQEKTNLVLGFKRFLPDGFKIVVKNGTVYYRTPEKPFLSLATKPLNRNESSFHDATKKRARFESQYQDDAVKKRARIESQYQDDAKRHGEYFAIKKLNEDLSQIANEAELQLNNRTKELEAKEKELDDAKSELKAKETELEDVTNGAKVKRLEQSLYALKRRTERETKALQAANKKVDDVSKYVIRKKNEEIFKKDKEICKKDKEICKKDETIDQKEKDIISKDSVIKKQQEEIVRLKQELSKAITAKPIHVKTLQKDLLSELECPICLDPFEDPCIVPECCHRFCTSCIENSIKECGKECPLCRKRVTSKRALRKDGFIERITDIIFHKK